MASIQDASQNALRMEVKQMKYKNILVDERNDGALIVTINRPPLNFMNIEAIIEMNSVLEHAKNSKAIKVVVFKGAGPKCFSAGVAVEDHLGDKAPIMGKQFDLLFQMLVECGKPTLAVIRGAAMGGGCELVDGCDMAIASEKSIFGQPEISIGAYPAPASVFLPRIVGRKKAFEIIFTGNNIDAKEAERIGLVNRVVPDGELETAAEALIESFLSKSSIILSMSKSIFYGGLDIEQSIAWRKAFTASEELLKTKDATEGLTSYLERRKPVWKNE